jgi:hypothetical protein|tara:strand:- start:10233 stop:11516 length:1284 start_codon:yes stop_codon:yes gene_type:complete
MSTFGDDFADFEGGGADARGGGTNYDRSPTGQQGRTRDFSSDDDNNQAIAQQAAALKAARDSNFARQLATGRTTIGFSDPRGGTTISGNLIKGGKISGFNKRDVQKEQLLSQFGYGDERSDAYKSFLLDTGASLNNPFGDSNVLTRGIFANLFDAKDLDYSRSLTPEQRKEILENKFINYVTPATKERFGSILGSAEGEASLYGDRVRGVRPQGFEEGIAGLALGTMMPGLGTLEARNRTRFAAPEMLPQGFEQPQGGFVDRFLSGFGGILQPTPETSIRAIDKIGEAGSDLMQRGRDFGAGVLETGRDLGRNLMSGIRSLIPDAEVDQVVDTVRRPELNQTVSGGRFEDESARTQQEAVPTAFQDFSTMPGSITNAYPELFVEPEVFTPNTTTITSGAPPFARMEIGPAARANVLLNQLDMRKGIR